MDRRIVLGVLVVVPLVAACGGGVPTTGPQLNNPNGDIQHKEYFYQGNYPGRRVTVCTRVSDVLAPRVVEVSGGDLRDAKLLVVTDQPVDISEGQAVRVTENAGQLHTSFPSDHVPYEQEDLYTRYGTKPYLYHGAVEPLAATQHSATESVGDTPMIKAGVRAAMITRAAVPAPLHPHRRVTV